MRERVDFHIRRSQCERPHVKLMRASFEKNRTVFGKSGWRCKQRPALKTNREQPARELNYYFYYQQLTTLSYSGTLTQGFDTERRLGRRWGWRIVWLNRWRCLKTREERKQREHSRRHEAIWPSSSVTCDCLYSTCTPPVKKMDLPSFIVSHFVSLQNSMCVHTSLWCL